MNEFAANLEVTPVFVRGFIVLTTRTWAMKIGMSYAPADVQFDKMQASFKRVRDRLISLGKLIYPKKAEAQIRGMLFAPPALIALLMGQVRARLARTNPRYLKATLGD